MGPNDTETAAADDPLRPTACPRCDYSLAGLPAAGVCPECGRAYGPEPVVLYGHAGGARANDWTRRPLTARQLARAWVWGIAAVVAVLTLAVVGGWPKPVGFGFVLLAAVRLTVATARTTTGAGSGVVQVRLGPAGFYQGTRGAGAHPYAGADVAALVSWTNADRVELRSELAGQARLTITSPIGEWPLVDAVVRCTPAAASALSGRITAWRAAVVTTERA